MPDIFISEKPKKKKDKKSSHKKGVSKKKKEKKKKRRFIGNSQNPFFAFSYHPEKMEFETKESEEDVLLVLRRHPITNAGWMIITVLMIFAPIVLSFFPLLSFLPAAFQFIAVLGWYLVTTAFVLQNFLTWFYNVDIVTDERIVDIAFYNILYKQVSDAKIDRIQDITYTMSGAARSIFNFGDVFIQTAGEQPNFEFLAVPDPKKVVEVLQEERLEEEREKLEGRVR